MNDANVKTLESLNTGLIAIFDRNTRRLENSGDTPHPALRGIEEQLHDELAKVLGRINTLRKAHDDFESDTPEDCDENIKNAKVMNHILCQLVADMHPKHIKERISEETFEMTRRNLSREFDALNALSDQSQRVYDAELQTRSKPQSAAPIRRLSLAYSAQ